MTEHHWFYVREGRREGPVRRARLLELVRGGWLAPDDLVWTEGMPEWVPAGTVDWLFGGRVARAVHGMLDAATHAPPRRPATARRRPAPLVDWENVEARHVVAVAGGLLAALGAAFLLIASSPLAWWLLVGGAVLLAVGLHVELGPLATGLVAAIGRRLAPAPGGADGPPPPQRRGKRAATGGEPEGRRAGRRRRRRRRRHDARPPREDQGQADGAPRRRRRRRDRGESQRRPDGGSRGT